MQNVLRIHGPLTLLLLRATYGRRVHETRLAAATPSPCPAGSRCFQALGWLACPLPQVEMLRPTQQPRGQARALEEKLAHQALPYRRLRSEQGHSRVKRGRMVKDRLRLWKQGSRDLVMELCCALHTFRVRLTPWQSMI